jgi:chromosome segregation ATPase
MDERYTNRGTIMKMVLSPGARIENRGTIMHLDADAVSDVTIIQHGTIMHASGCTVIKSTGSLHTDAVKEVIREVPRQEDLERISKLSVENSKLKAQIETLRTSRQPKDEDIYWGRKRIKQQRETIERLTHTVDFLRDNIKSRDGVIERLEKEIERLRSREYVRRVEIENESLRQDVSYLNGVANDLRNEVAELQQQLEASDRQRLLDTIEELQDKLTCAKNRETVMKFKARDAEMQAYRATQQVWDQYKPTKEQVKSYFRKITNMMDCETDY